VDQKVIRWIDKNIGRPLCFIFTVHKRLCALLKNNAHVCQKPVKILFIKLVEQGSTVLAYPALKKAADLVGKENIYFMTFKKNRPILDVLDIVPTSNVIEINSETFGEFIQSARKAIGKTRKENIDSVIDMEFFSRASAILAYLSGAKKMVGLHLFTSEGPYRGDLFTHRLLYNPYLHMKLYFTNLVEALLHDPPTGNVPLVFEAPSVDDGLPQFVPTENEKTGVIESIKQLKNGLPNNPIILLNPNVSDMLPIRRWPREHFIALGKMLLQKLPKATIIVTGGEGEKNNADRIASEIGNAVSLAGHTSLRELLTVYCLADILVTNDSGPGHFSALTPVNAIVIFGPETPLLYGVLEENVTNIVPNYACSPCVNVYNHRKSPCLTAPCLQSITVESVYTCVEKLLLKSTH